MTVKEKRGIVLRYCEKTSCRDCKLKDVRIWQNPCSMFFKGLNYATACEADLDEAIKIIAKTELDEASKILAEKLKITADDNVEHPTHYTSGGIECIDAIKASMSSEEYKGFLKSQVIKYVWRYRLKGKPTEDLKKARFYLDRLITESEASEND